MSSTSAIAPICITPCGARPRAHAGSPVEHPSAVVPEGEADPASSAAPERGTADQLARVGLAVTAHCPSPGASDSAEPAQREGASVSPLPSAVQHTAAASGGDAAHGRSADGSGHTGCDRDDRIAHADAMALAERAGRSIDLQQREAVESARPSEAAVVTAQWRAAPDALPPHWDEREALSGEALTAARADPLPFISRRRAEPESAEVLARRPLPLPTVAVATEATSKYRHMDWPAGSPPRPVAAHQLWLDGVYAEIREAIAGGASACERGERTGSASKAEHRVFPVELMAPFARAHVEAGGAFDLGDPSDVQILQPYSASDPVPATVSKPFFAKWASATGHVDRDMLDQVAVIGVESRPECSSATIVMGHHRGFRDNYAAAAESIRADEQHGFITPGRRDPWTVPAIMVARNCVPRRQWKLVGEELQCVTKWRVTTDDSISIEDEVSRNDGIDREAWARAGLPAALTLAEAVAIVKARCAAMGIALSQSDIERVALWALDLTHAFRMLSVSRAEWRYQQFVFSDGVRLDLRCVFGTASMVEFFQRVTSFVLSIAQRRTREFDAQHPYDAPRQAWCNFRDELAGVSGDPSFSEIYIDDAIGATCLGRFEALNGRADTAERPVHASLHAEPDERGEWRVKLALFACKSRPETHLEITLRTFAEAGWDIASEKVQLGFSITELGLQCSSLGDGRLAVPEAKRRGMIEDIRKQQPPPRGDLPANQLAPFTDVERLRGQCGHIAQIATEANAHMAAMYAITRYKVLVRVKGGGGRRMRVTPHMLKVAGSGAGQRAYQQSLAWWRHALEAQVSAPLSPRLVFPDLAWRGVGFMFTDAAREALTGHGAFTMVRDDGELLFLDMAERWPRDLQRALYVNRLSMPAGELVGAVAFADALAEALPGLAHLVVFTDSDAARATIRAGNSGSPQLNAIIQWLLERRPALQLLALHQPGARNGVSDRLSRHGAAAVRAEAVAAGARVITLPVPNGLYSMMHAAIELEQR